MARGTVKWFNTMKGYGFIKPDDRKNNLFFHVRNFPFGKIPEPACALAYDIGPDASERPQAVKVVPW